MKISTMLKREDFYEINRRTLDNFYQSTSGKTRLYIYPELNAIVTKRPHRAVKEYLLDEYHVRGSLLKRTAVQLYVRGCLASGGLAASRHIDLTADVTEDTLIYPCNKKYRIFNFSKNLVWVIIKDTFDRQDLRHEVAFRSSAELPAFVPRLLCAEDDRYCEEIIDGMPLARISDGFETLRDEAYRELSAYSRPSWHEVNAVEYVRTLRNRIEHADLKKVKNPERLMETVELLQKKSAPQETVPVGFSHGDLQAGNIWVENQTGKVFIIDWESWGERSVWYDQAVLYGGLRPWGIEFYLNHDSRVLAEKSVVLLEDILFQLNELNSLPKDFGESNFDDYMSKLHMAVGGYHE